MGRIGRLVADAYAVWGARVIVHDPVQGSDPYPRVPLSTVADEADLISLHAPLLAETHHIVDASFLSRVARRPHLVNVSRGALVDTFALAEALLTDSIAGAGIDVFESEPLAADHPLRTAPNTILTPHGAWCSVDALPELRKGAVKNVIEALER
jgi:D-3-phosphoglycerate dehydrogenase